MDAARAQVGRVVGRYVVFDEIAAGGMATVHLGRLIGEVGFSRTVAIKRLHPHLARDGEFATMFLDEARLAARVRHPNVVGVLDVVHDEGELLLVMDYVHGESLSRLARAMKPGGIPPRLACTVVMGLLHGLHAAHEATTEQGAALEVVHRDVSPQNVMVGVDGVARVFDFGVAKASHRVQTTQDGAIKGKIAYMAPEQLLSESVDRRADIYAAAVVLWEVLTGERLFEGENQGRVIRKILDEPVPVPSSIAPGLPKALDAAIMKGLERDVDKRWQTARDFANALERCTPLASSTQVGEWVESIGGSGLEERDRRVKEIEKIDHAGAFESAASGEPLEDESGQRERPTLSPARPSAPELPAAPTERLATPAPSSSPFTTAERPSSPGLAAISSRQKAAASGLSPASVQTIAVTPLASLEAVHQKRQSGKRMLFAGVALAVFGVLAAIFAITWTLLHKR